MPGDRLRIGEFLVEAGVISRDQLGQALELQKQDGRRLGTILLATGFVSESQLTQALSKQLSVPWVSVSRADPPDDVLQLVPSFVASQYGLVPVYVRNVKDEGESLYVAMDDPTNEEALRAVAAASGMPVQPMVAAPSEIARAIIEFYEDEQDTGQLQLPPPLLDAAEASGRQTAPTLAEVPRRRKKSDTTPMRRPGAPRPDSTDEVVSAQVEEEYMVVGPAPPEEWEQGQSAGAVFSPGNPEDASPASGRSPMRIRSDEHILPEAMETAHHLEEDVLEEDTDQYLLPEVRAERARAERARRAAQDAGSDEDLDTNPAARIDPAVAQAKEAEGGAAPAALEPGGTVDENVEAIEARIAASEQAKKGRVVKKRKRKKRRSVSLTLLDGTRIDFNNKEATAKAAAERRLQRPVSSVSELVGLLKASGRGDSMPKALPNGSWEHYIAALVELLLSKGILTEEELLDRLLRK